MKPEEKIEIDGSYCPEIKSRWKSYRNYRLIIWSWMLNEITIVFSPVEISHNGFYPHALLQILSVILIGMPLAYSEICLAQYTNCNLFTMWNFFPLFQNIGYGTLYLILLKTVYLLVLTSWYIVYTFYSALDTPPWLSCDDYGDTKCMVKRVNVSTFQHCLEAQILFEDDCGIKTASACFFEREISLNCTHDVGFFCLIPWKVLVAVLIICVTIYILSIKQEQLFQVLVKLISFYICIVVLVLFFVALSTSGSWYSSKIAINWNSYTFLTCYSTIARGFLSVGTGYGMLIFLTRDVSFRSPATMTAISTTLFSLFISLVVALIAFSGIKTMSYYHGEEENVIEIGTSVFFPAFASMSEIMGYFDAMPIWGYLWFSTGFCCLYLNFWMVYLFLKDLVFQMNIAKKYPKLSCMFLTIFIIFCTFPFLCSDITAVLSDAVGIIQTANSLFFSISLYWIYGIHKHNVDIIFMIGIKTNVFLKLAWLLNPIHLAVILYARLLVIVNYESTDSYKFASIEMTCDLLVLYILLSIYVFIILGGFLVKLIKFYRNGIFSRLFFSKDNWGPRDRILSKSRKMFVPEIMTREFLYRQVLIRGYYKKLKTQSKKKIENSKESTTNEMAWSAMTSN